MKTIKTILAELGQAPAAAGLEALYGAGSVPFQSGRYRELLERHRKNFGHDRAEVYSAPGRTEIGGNHTDHNLGKVIAAGVDLDSLAAVTPREDRVVRVQSSGWEPFELVLDDLNPREEERESSPALVRGAARFLLDRGWKIGGFDCTVSSRVLPGSGLSSSASFEVLLGAVFSGLYNRGEIPLTILARAGQYGENVHYGKPCGLMDQMACAHGGVVALDFRDPEAPEIETLSVDFSLQGFSLLVTNTPGDHRDLSAHYAAIPAEMRAVAGLLGKTVCRELDLVTLIASAPAIRKALGDRAFLRAFHFLEENRRVEGQLEALKRGDLPGFLELVNRSGRSSFQYLQNISVPGRPENQPLAVALALAESRLDGRGACRVHGGGFAGTILAFVPTEDKSGYTRFMDGVFGGGSTLEIAVRNRPAGRVFG